MSKKTITFQNPSKGTLASATPRRASAQSQTELAVDQWVHRSKEIAEAALAAPFRHQGGQNVPNSVTISISAEPDLFEMTKIWFLLPYLTFSFWTLGIMQQNLQFFARRTDGNNDPFDWR